MNWYKKAQINWQDETIQFLTELNIVNEKSDNLIKVQRDSIVNTFNKEESESYRELIRILNNHFNARFNYALKNDDWFWLEKII